MLISNSIAVTLLTLAGLAFIPATADAQQNIDLSTTLPETVRVRYTGNLPNSADIRNIAPAGDFNGDGIDDVVIGDSLGGVDRSGGAYLVLGNSNASADFDLTTLSSDHSRGFRMSSTRKSSLTGSALAPAGDFNGDGFDDVLIGSYGSNQVSLVFGRPDPQQNINLDSFTTSTEFGFHIYSTPTTISGAGDMNGDGLDDIAVIYQNSLNRTNVLVIFGRRSGFSNITPDNFPTSDTNGFRIGGSPLSAAPNALGDFNGDGFDDMLVGPGRYSFIVYGKPTGHADIDVWNAAPGTVTHIDINCAGNIHEINNADYNGDGLADLLLGSSCFEYTTAHRGAVYVIFGRTETSSTIDLAELATSNAGGFRIDGKDGKSIGQFTASAGDINADGIDDILVGAGDSAYAIFGRPTAQSHNIDLITAEIPGSLGFEVIGATGQYGKTLSAAGDFNNDGYQDFVYGQSVSNQSNIIGINNIIFGRPSSASQVRDWLNYNQ